MKALAIAALLLATPAALALPDPGLPTPCDPMLLDFLCTVWQGVMRYVEKVCGATTLGCPQGANVLAGPCDNDVEKLYCDVVESVEQLLWWFCNHGTPPACQVAPPLAP